MKQSLPGIAAVVLALVLGACSGTASSPPASLGVTVPTGPPVQLTPTPTPTPTPTVTPSPSPSASVVPKSPTAIDPCTLLTSADASDVNGVTYGAGVSHQMDNGFVECVWQANGGSVVVQLLVAPSVDLAQEAYAEAEANFHGFSPTPVANFADEAEIARAPGGTVSTGGIYVRDGTTYFDVVYLGGSAPSDAQLQLTATLVLRSLP